MYVDPAFAFPGGVRGVALKALFALAPRPSRSSLVRWNPKWDPADVEIELATLAAWDKRTILGLANTRRLMPPERLVAPSLVVLAETSWLISAEVAARLAAQGMTVERIPGTGHTVFRDEHHAFMDVVDRWLARVVPARVES